MITIHLMGGLGNQLFQIFACISYCLRHKLPFKIPENKRDLKSAQGSDRPTYWDTFFQRLKPFLLKKLRIGPITAPVSQAIVLVNRLEEPNLFCINLSVLF